MSTGIPTSIRSASSPQEKLRVQDLADGGFAQANIATYDYSALLYLNTHGEDFTGGTPAPSHLPTHPLRRDAASGRFRFLDKEQDAIVEPKAGRLVSLRNLQTCPSVADEGVGCAADVHVGAGEPPPGGGGG